MNATIGYVYDHYTARRTIINAAPACRYTQVGDHYRTQARAARMINRCLHASLLDEHDSSHQFRASRNASATDLMHLFNQVSYGTHPWVATFETALPRFRSTLQAHHGETPPLLSNTPPSKVARALNAMAAAPCRRLLALSRCAADIQLALLSAAPHWQETIGRKLEVLPPPQPLLLRDCAQKPPLGEGPLRLMFVGDSFFRKGGVELLETARALVREHGYELELTLVSSLRLDSYAAAETRADQDYARGLIEANREWIHLHEGLDNAAVLQLMRQADIGLLPTYAETYGFSVLEFQAAACPVITTDIRALPEINNEQCGWVIPIPKNSLGEALYQTRAGRERISSQIRMGLLQHLRDAYHRRDQIRAKGSAALQRVARDHDPRRLGERLASIYAECAASPALTQLDSLTTSS